MDKSKLKKDVTIVYAVALMGLIVTIIMYIGYFTPEWKKYQSEFKRYVSEKLGEEKAKAIEFGVKQIYVKELNRVDRCITCHMGYEWKGLENAPNPFKTHPKEILDKHPLQKYGCTICHGGQGYALNKEEAHGFIEHWEEPLLGKELEDIYSPPDRKVLLQMNCNICHRYDTLTPGADYINYAKKLVKEKGCRACHKINGRGGVIGPDLTYEGDKAPEQFDYSRIGGYKSVFAWHVAHFKNPKMVSPESIMPEMGFGSKEAIALTLLTMSWKKVNLPPEYYPQSYTALADLPTPEEIEKERQMREGEGAFFVNKGCFVCHSISVFGIESAAKIGPDLSNALEDVQSRFGKTLENFIKEPTGTMAIVLGSQIVLSDSEKVQVVELLTKAYEKYRKQQLTSKH